MTTALEWLSTIAPNLTATTEVKNNFIAMAADETDETLFQNADKYNMAIAYLAAHFLFLATQSGGESKGNLTMEKEGDLQRSYAKTTDIASGNPSSTQYLDNYNMLLQGRVPIFFIQDGRKNSGQGFC